MNAFFSPPGCYLVASLLLFPPFSFPKEDSPENIASKAEKLFSAPASMVGPPLPTAPDRWAGRQARSLRMLRKQEHFLSDPWQKSARGGWRRDRQQEVGFRL